MNKLKLSIQLKVTLLLGLLGVLFVTILFFTIEEIVKNDISKIEYQKAEIILKTIEPTIAVNHFLELDSENKEFIKKLMSNEDIMGICIFFNEQPFHVQKPTVDKKELFRLEYPIKDVVSNEVVGSIILHYTKKYYNNTVKTMYDRFVIISILIITIVFIVFFIVRYMFKSLVKISDVIANYKIGNSIDFSHIKKEDETAQIMNIISNLVERINEHNEQMYLKQIELEEARENAENASRFKSEFLANMSHEIRTPMNGVLGFVDQLSKAETNPERLKQFSIVKNSGETLLSIINDILDFSKIETGKMELESHPADVKQLFGDTAAIFTELVNNKKIIFKSTIDENLPKCLLIDQVRLKQVVFNLLSNAIKFTPEKGSVSLIVDIKQESNILHCSVIDSGIGIAKENQAKIFDAFGQEDSSTTRKFGGTGLGLSISSKLISMMGGQLQVSSELGKGSQFYFDIPMHQCDKNSIVEQDALSDNTNHTLSLPKSYLLVVEDNRTNQMLIGIILDELGLTYDIAADGFEAIKLFKENIYDAILMDENMPNMNGIEATKNIRRLEEDKSLKATPIIAVTANALSEDRERFINAGMDEYVSKPYSEKDIVNVLQKILG